MAYFDDKKKQTTKPKTPKTTTLGPVKPAGAVPPRKKSSFPAKRPYSAPGEKMILEQYANGDNRYRDSALEIMDKMVAPPKSPKVPYPEDEMARDRRQLRAMQAEEDKYFWKPPAGAGNPDQMSLPKKRKK